MELPGPVGVVVHALRGQTPEHRARRHDVVVPRRRGQRVDIERVVRDRDADRCDSRWRKPGEPGVPACKHRAGSIETIKVPVGPDPGDVGNFRHVCRQNMDRDATDEHGERPLYVRGRQHTPG